jgi:hypothetical protein
MKETKEMFDKSSRGAPPDSKTEIPEFLTSEKTLLILEEIMRKSHKKMQQALM